ncbi:MAG: DEAD/DEAH box helicase [Deltaproteobacteria bacterium]|nr:DEAD/DEAH box helicase [Deltaproteobacteria bacterium]
MDHLIPPPAGTSEPGSDNDNPELDLDEASEFEAPVEATDDEATRPRANVPLKDIAPEVAALGVNSFADLPLHPDIAAAIGTMGWHVPTPVQKLCLPYTLRSRDVAGFAQTGTGKTAVFLITILNKLLSTESREPRVPRAIVIAPTRELAMQSEQDAEQLFAQSGLKSMAVFGGIDYDKQAREITDGVDVIFATPGRLKDFIQKKVVKLENIACFVCDEADRMFDMGFIEDVEFFLERIPTDAQRLLFSATTNEQVKELAFEYLENPEYISVNPETITPERIEQNAVHCHATEKLRVLLGLLADHKPDCAIIFTNTKLTAEWLYYKLQHNGVDADLISGDLPQKKRISLIHKIKEGKIKALVATDVASRGLHISRITHVYNFDLPDDAANYVHRIGRTARAGAKGVAFSLVCDDYGHNLAAINSLLGPLALESKWPDDRYLQIEDRAGNPFEDRYQAHRERKGERRDRDPRHGASRDGQHRSKPRDGAKFEAQPQRGGVNANATAQPNSNGNGKRRRRRGKGQRDQNGAPHHTGYQLAQPSQIGSGHGSRHGQRSGFGKDLAPSSDAAPKTMLGMIMKLLKTLFGLGKR